VSRRVGVGRCDYLIPFIVFFPLFLGACGGGAYSTVSVAERSAPLRQPESEYREVVAGDTLYSIAWESGRDYRELASWNNIAPPYTIKPGQRIRLYPPSSTATAAPSAAGPSSHVVQKGETLFSIATRYDVAVADLAAWNNIAPPYILRQGQSLRLITSKERPAAKTDNKRNGKKPTHKTPPAVSTAKPAPVPASVRNASIRDWAWPAEGSLLSRFNAGGAKGVDIGGKPGQSILAAAAGTVVYQGSGLRGYGQLIIVKHNTDFLSAYAHCDKIVVREGNVIKRGQKIAEMGSTGTDRVKLHFEIRYRGTPVDPLDYLPKR
jgi:lipoprotein NlpD